MELPAEARAGGVAPHWLAYVAVDDVDAIVERARKLGAGIVLGPDTVPGIGRFVILRDPQGAVIGAYQPAREVSADDREPEPGDFSWRELASADHEAALGFYSELFGWEGGESMGMKDGGVYQICGRAGRLLGGMYNKTADQPRPTGWLYYIKVDGIEATVRNVQANGGKIVLEPMDVAGGSRIAVGVDLQGAAFAMHQAG